MNKDVKIEKCKEMKSSFDEIGIEDFDNYIYNFDESRVFARDLYPQF
jgi:hypothetical protein